MKKKTILVIGDPVCDHNFYKGERQSADALENIRGFRYDCIGGGALLVKKIIAETMQDAEEWTTEFGLNPHFESLPLTHHAFCCWEPQASGGGKSEVRHWRAVEPPFGYGHPEAELPSVFATKSRPDAYERNPDGTSESPNIVVIDDAGVGFRKSDYKDLWQFVKVDCDEPSPQWVVLKLTGSFGKTDFWNAIVGQCNKNLVVIVSAEELRRRDVRISRGLSWEATAEDLVAELRNNPIMKPLMDARHLVITFQADGAFWFDNDPKGPKSLLVFDAPRAEGEWAESQGKGSGGYGYLSCLTAAVVRELCVPSDKSNPDNIKPDFEAALGAGLSAIRELRQIGHGEVVVGDQKAQPGFPFDKIVAQIKKPTTKFVSALIPPIEQFGNKLNSVGGRARGHWMMLDEWQVQAQRADEGRPHNEAAQAVAVLGLEALERFPVAQFGKYQTVDRKEVESLRTIRQLINNYLKMTRPENPLNFGVFGPPGSGKSYIVKQIAKAVKIAKEDVLLFNLSQFKDANDICGAFHQIRDKVLKGTTPFVFWDEFDSQGYRWLQYLLAPMEDGEFQEGQITHPIGKCIFAFAGATSSTFEQFGPINPSILGNDQLTYLEEKKPDLLRDIEKDWRDFVLAKGPDFKSRLVTYLNLLGMNRRQECKEENGRRRWVDDPKDLCFPIRRALFMRSIFELKKDEKLELDLSVLRALLEIPRYTSAGRSLQVLCNNLKKNSTGKPVRSNLPGFELLNMHVDAARFWKICESDQEFLPLAEEFAKDFHNDWCKNPVNKGKADNKPWAELNEDIRSTNIQQALRIAANLSVVGLLMEKGTELPPNEEKEILDYIDQHIETLAEAEHNGWMVERMIAGWRYAKIPKKDTVKKLHPLLLPYAQLPDVEKDKDRRPIRGFSPNATEQQADEKPAVGYIGRLRRCGYRIVFTEAAKQKRQSK